VKSGSSLTRVGDRMSIRPRGKKFCYFKQMSYNINKRHLLSRGWNARQGNGGVSTKAEGAEESPGKIRLSSG